MQIINIIRRALHGLSNKPVQINKFTRFYSQHRKIPSNIANHGVYYRVIAAVTLTSLFVALYKKGNNKSVKDSLKLTNLSYKRPREKFNFINDVVEKCAEAVVYVEIQDPKRIDKGTEEPIILSNGSGFLIREDGWVLTNAHVVVSKPHAIISIQMRDGRRFQASVEDADMNVDLALLKIDVPQMGKKLPVLELGGSGDVSIGEWVVALGSPLSLSHSVTAGVVSCVNREATELGLMNYNMHYIQTDASITFGNSGGPLVNLDGEVIGINNLRITAGISFAIPVEYVKKFLVQSKHYSGIKTVGRDETILGMTTIQLTENVLKDMLGQYKDSPKVEHGLLVWKLLDQSLARKNGLETGDIITEINGMPVKEPSDIYKFFAQDHTAEKRRFLNFHLIREGKVIELNFDASSPNK